jgi:hypothetical protein
VWQGAGLSPTPARCFCLARTYSTGTVIVSDTLVSSLRVMVASPNSTSVTVAVHCGFGHDPAGAEGVIVVTVNLKLPFLGVGWGPLVPVAVVVKL